MASDLRILNNVLRSIKKVVRIMIMMIMGRLMEMHLDAKHTLMFIKST